MSAACLFYNKTSPGNSNWKISVKHTGHEMEFINNRTENELACKFIDGCNVTSVYMQIGERFAFYIHN